MSERFGTLHEMIAYAKKPKKAAKRQKVRRSTASSRLMINPIKLEPVTSRRAILKHIKEVYE